MKTPIQELTNFRLRHYGADAYDPEKFKPISDGQWVKPKGGLWTSPIASEYGWKDWCECERFGDLTKSFDVNFSGCVLTIDTVEDLKKLSWGGSSGWAFPFFEPLMLMGVDAIHLTVRGQQETRFSSPRNLYGWDCETVLVMNPACILV